MPNIPATFLRPDLGVLVSEQMLGDGRFIAPTIFPEMPVQAISDTFTRIDVKAGTQNPDTSYAGGRPNKVDFGVVEDSYRCAPHAIEQAVRDIDKGRVKGRFDMEAIAAAIPALVLMTDMEKEAEGVLNNNVNLPLSGNTGATVSNDWANPSTSTPIVDVLAGQARMRAKTGGMVADTMILPWKAWSEISQSDQILGRIKNVDMSVTNGLLQGTVLNALFQVNRILIPGAYRDTANQGLAASIQEIWSPDYVYLLITAPSGYGPTGARIPAPTQGIAQVGRIMTYSEPTWGGGTLAIAKHRIEEEYTDLYHALGNWQVKFFSSAFAYRLKIRP